jgi:stage II sporulation protein AA (anti-sigma F factor antagonist)
VAPSAQETAYVALDGDLDFSSRESLSAALPDANAIKGVILDFRNVRYIDSAGLGILIGFRKRFVAAGGRSEKIVIVAQPGGTVRKVLEIAGLPRVFTITDTVPDGEKT